MVNHDLSWLINGTIVIHNDISWYYDGILAGCWQRKAHLQCKIAFLIKLCSLDFPTSQICVYYEELSMITTHIYFPIIQNDIMKYYGTTWLLDHAMVFYSNTVTFSAGYVGL